MATPQDEGRHEPDAAQQLWNESWYFDFAAEDGSIGGYVRLGLYPNLGVAWYWGYLVREGEQLLAVKHHESKLPKGDVLEVKEDGLWSQLHCETPHDHWTIGLEAFAVGLDDPGDAYANADPVGDKVPLGLDLEWQAQAPVYDYPGVTRYEQSCLVTGEILVGNQAISFDGWGQRDHSWGVRDWWGTGWVWTAGRLDDGTAFHATKVESDRFDYEPGYVARPDAEELEVASQFKPAYTQEGEHRFPSVTAMPLHDLDLTTTPLLLAPIRLDAPDGRIGRFPRALCRFDAADGRSGYGWTEWNRPG
jgi:hypothetical protein